MEAQPSTMSVYDRLYDTRSYTGTHSSRAANHGGGSGGTRKAKSRSFVGNTNANTDEVIRDISQITRPNLNRTPTRNRMKKSARSKADISMEAAIAGGLPSTLDTNAQLKLIFRYYCRFGRTTGDNDMLHNANWAKFCRECPELLDGRAITNAEIDLTFTKSKGKKERRLSYGRFLDALSALASKKFPDADAATGFSMLLARHVFRCPAAVAGGDTSSTHRTHPSDRRPSRTRRSSSGKRPPPQAPSPSTGRYGGGGGGGGGHGQRPVPAPGAAVSAGRQSWRQAPPAQPPTSSFMLYNQEPTMFMEEVGSGHSAGGSAPNAAPAADAAGHAGAPPPPLVHADAAPDHDRRDYGTQDAGAGSGDYQYTSYAAAVATARAAAAAHAATRARDISNLHASGASSGAPAAAAAGAAPDAGSAPSSRQDGTPGAATSSGAAAPRAAAPAASTAVAAPPGGGAFVHPSQPATTAVGASAPLSPAAIAATAAAAAAQAAASSQGDAGAAAAASALYHATYAAHAAQLAMQQAAAQARAHGIELPPALMAPLTGPGGQVFSSPYRAPVAGGELAMPAGMVYQQQPAQPHRTPTKGRKGKPPMTPGSTPRRRRSERATPRSGGRRGSTGSQKQLSSAPSSASNTAVPLGTTPSRHAMVTSASFRPRKSTLPGEGIKPGSVYDRLTNPGSFTGVYRRAWETDGRMNAHADIASAKSFRGNTNTNSNANIHDISMTLRPSLSMSPARRKAFR